MVVMAIVAKKFQDYVLCDSDGEQGPSSLSGTTSGADRLTSSDESC